jgi:hypothetical protein
VKRLAAVAALAVLLPCAPAAAAERGEAQLQLGGKAAKQLERAGVAIGARRPAAGRSRVTLPVTRADVGAIATVRLGGALRLRKGRRTVSLQGLRLSLRPRGATLSAAVGGRRMSALSGRYAPRRLSLDRSTGRVLLSTTTLKLARPAARRIARRLKLARVPGGALARLAVGIPAQTAPGSTAPGAPGAPGGGGSATTPQQSLPRLARPATAVPITSASIDWHVRDSFVEYMNSGEGTSVAGGATAGAPQERCGGGASYVYDFAFPFAEGWYDPPSGTAAVYFEGAVRFRYSAHGIDITTSQPEIEINGESSRAIFRFKDADGDRRGVLANMKRIGTPAPAERCHGDTGPAGSANPQVSGTTYTYERMAGEVPDGTADSVFAGFYLAGDPFGWFTVTFTTP